MDIAKLIDVARLAIEEAIKRGASEAEAYALFSEECSCSIENNKLSQASQSSDIGIGVRVVIGKKIGFAYTNSIDSESVLKAVKRGLSIASVSTEDPEWRSLPEPAGHTPIVAGIYSDKLATVGIGDVVSEAQKLLEPVHRDQRLFLVQGGVSVGSYVKVIVNSHGVEASCRGTIATVGAEMVANDGVDATPVVLDFDASRTELPNTETLARELAEKALSLLHPVRFEKSRALVVFGPLALLELISYTLLVSLRADSVVNKRSPFTNKIGHEIASPLLTLIDDGVLPQGVATEPIDDEGMPRRRTVLIERGILRGFVADSYWGNRLGTGSTGNATRAGYTTTPRIGFTNIVIEPGTTKLEEILSEIDYGLLVHDLQGAHSSNPESGEFSVVAAPAWLVQRGELKPVRGVMIAGNLYSLLKDITALSREQIRKGTIVTPIVLFQSIRTVQK